MGENWWGTTGGGKLGGTFPIFNYCCWFELVTLGGTESHFTCALNATLKKNYITLINMCFLVLNRGFFNILIN